MTSASDVQPLRLHASKRVIPTCLAILPIGLLFGVLAVQAKWTASEVLIFSALGFSGSGQFALLPLADSAIGFSTMLFLAIAINSRYIPIAFSTASRLPKSAAPRALMAHLLGDEAFALEQSTDRLATVAAIRFSIFGTWVVSSVGGVFLANLLPDLSLIEDINIGIPASLVLLILSTQQINQRLFKSDRSKELFRELTLCVSIALAFFWLLGPLWFWLPSILLMTWRFVRIGL
jgi:predicted branched-subunit amino acid permease